MMFDRPASTVELNLVEVCLSCKVILKVGIEAMFSMELGTKMASIQ